jgi:tetraacyldisaccharide-1-P 4'-kinase
LGVERWFTLGTTDEPASLLEPPGTSISPAEAPRVVIVSGIARPAGFLADVERRGWQVAETLVFRDHHRFSRADVARMAARVAATGADLVLTTEKDAVRLLPLRPLPVRVASLPLRVRIEPAEEFAAWLRGRIGDSLERAKGKGQRAKERDP